MKPGLLLLPALLLAACSGARPAPMSEDCRSITSTEALYQCGNPPQQARLQEAEPVRAPVEQPPSEHRVENRREPEPRPAPARPPPPPPR